MPSAESTRTTLARLSFWAPAEQMAEFEAAYGARLAPVLKQHDLVESAQRGRQTVAGVFSRLFEMESPAEVVAKRETLEADPAWQEVLRDLGTIFGTEDRVLRWNLGVYTAPAGRGTVVEAGPGFRQGLWQSFGVQDGLPSSAIRRIFQDRAGHLWIISETDGVSRYDGVEFATFTMQDGLVSDLVQSAWEDREGYLWFATYGGGVSRYDGEHFVSFTTADGLAHDDVWSILEDRAGNLWFGTAGGVSRYDGKEFTTFTVEDGLGCSAVGFMLQDRKGSLWFTAGPVGEEGVCRFDGQAFKTFTTEDGLADNRGWSMLEDREGNLWFASGWQGKGVSRYDGKEFKAFTVADGLADNRVCSMLEDRTGGLWFGTRDGVSQYDGKEFKAFTTEDGVGHSNVQSILEDRAGIIWFGSIFGGVSRYDGVKFTAFAVQEGLAGTTVNFILEDRAGNIWIAVHGGVSRYDGGQFAVFTTREGLANNGVMSVLEDREGNLWCGTWGGVSRYDGVEFTAPVKELEGTNVRALCEDRSGNLWVSTETGICRYDGKDVVTFTTQDGLAADGGLSILEDREGNLWFGTGWLGKGVSRYAGKEFRTFSTEDGLADNTVWSILEDREGNLWFGTGRRGKGGASRYDGKEFVSFTTREGLVDNTVHFILQDRKGNLWFGTGGGVSLYDGKEFKAFMIEDGLTYDWVFSILEDRAGHLWFGTWGGGISCFDGLVFQTLSRKDGLPSDSVQKLIQSRDGDIWIATEGGVARYRPQRTPPKVRLTEVIADRRYDPSEEIRLPVSQQFVHFKFQGRSMTTRPEGMAYVYRLERYDAEWKPVYGRQVEYQDLPLGEYTFQVRAVDRDLNYSEPAEIRLAVVPDPRDARIDELEQRVRERTRELEEKNRALQVEAALERVGAAVAGMQRSADIGKVMRVMWEELRGQQLEFFMCAVTIVDEAHNLRTSYNVWDASDSTAEEHERLTRSEWRLPQAVGVADQLLTEKGLALRAIRSPLDADDWARASADRWRGRQSRAWAMTQEEIASHAQRLGIAPEDYIIRYHAFVPFAHGELSLATTNPDPDQLSSADLALLQRFAEVFDGGYARFLVFQRLERDRAAEQVRNRVSSMEHAGDLDGVVLQLRDALSALGIGFDDCGLQIMSQEGAAGEAIAVRADSDEVIHTRVESWAGPVSAAWERQEPVYRPDLEQEDRFGEADLLHRGIRSVVDVPFRYGTLALSSRQDKAFWPTDIETLQEFATAISGAYARYLDFQRLEAQNRALERASRFKSDFLARMSHDLRTPMNAIIGYTRILLRKAKDALDERQYRNLENIQLSADRLLSLINDILDLSRIEAGRIDLKPEPVDLEQLIAQCAASVESLLKPGVELKQEIADLAPLHTDADRLSRVLMNLLSNAVKFTEAGRITVSVKPAEGGVELSVADTGIGIPAEDLPHIFEEFRQSGRRGEGEKQGSGLGLAIARKSVELLGGSIEVESQVGKGTKFTLRIRGYEGG